MTKDEVNINSKKGKNITDEKIIIGSQLAFNRALSPMLSNDERENRYDGIGFEVAVNPATFNNRGKKLIAKIASDENKSNKVDGIVKTTNFNNPLLTTTANQKTVFKSYLSQYPDHKRRPTKDDHESNHDYKQEDVELLEFLQGEVQFLKTQVLHKNNMILYLMSRRKDQSMMRQCNICMHPNQLQR